MTSFSYADSHMRTQTVLLEKVTRGYYLNISVELKYLTFSISYITLSSVGSQELFNWLMARGRITYFINFVLDLHLILKVCFLYNLLISRHSSILFSHPLYCLIFYMELEIH